MTGQPSNRIDRRVVLAGALSGIVALGVLILVGMVRADMVFEYPLDDVYIHLAMAEQIAAGGYGVNAGEYASAASSPLYPLLLTPFAGSEAQRLLPLFWNVLSVAAGGALYALVMIKAGCGRAALPLALTAPVALNMYVTAYTGMENMAHGVASLMIVLGLWSWIEARKLSLLLVAGVILAPALRLEGLALAVSAAGVVFVTGDRKMGVVLAALAVLPVVAFSGLLLSLGLDALPNSVIAKLSSGDDGGEGLLARIASKFGSNISYRGGTLLFATTAALALISLMSRRSHPRRALFGLAVTGAALAHLAFGAIGWMDRYETYALFSVTAALALMLAGIGSGARNGALLAVFLAGLVTYFPPVVRAYTWNVAAIRVQQGEMARFAVEHAKVPVAVNDLGYVSWRNPDYVLDLWGLASSEALRTRLSNPPAGWGAPLAASRNVQLVMIYDRWLGDAVSPEWVRLGVLHLDVPRAFIGGYEVTFYATSPDAARDLQAILPDWYAELPELARFEIEEPA